MSANVLKFAPRAKPAPADDFRSLAIEARNLVDEINRFRNRDKPKDASK